MVRSRALIVLFPTIIIYSYYLNVLLYTTEFDLNEVNTSSLLSMLRQFDNRLGLMILSHN